MLGGVIKQSSRYVVKVWQSSKAKVTYLVRRRALREEDTHLDLAALFFFRTTSCWASLRADRAGDGSSG